MTTQIANFFWHGAPLSLYEHACLSSFVKSNFTVNLWTFDHLVVPQGVNLKNASDFFNVEDISKFTQDGKIGSLAAFSDAIRYHILNQQGGWWFDTDCFCLKNEKDFKELAVNKKIVAGWEDENNINGAVLYFNDKEIAKASLIFLDNICKEKAYNFRWGDIGPKLITSLIKSTDTLNDVVPTDCFYPVHYKDTMNFLNPKLTNEVENTVKNSYVVHLWNEIITKKQIDKSIMPPVGSFLYKKFLEVGK
jgi:mannosyltransferase OCH1-like enzyme